MKIHAPDKKFTGESRYGDLVLKFKDGEVEHDGDLPDAVRSYMAKAGYGIDEDAPEPEPAPEPVEHEPEARVGTPLQDDAEKPKRGGRRAAKAAEPEPEPEQPAEQAPDAPDEAQDN